MFGACAPSFDGTRSPAPGTFGEHVVELLCKRLAWQAEPTDVAGDHVRGACGAGDVPSDAPPAVAALLGDRGRIVAAIDAAVPAGFTDSLQHFMSDPGVLALYDDGTMAGSIASLADMLDDIAGDGAALTALSRLGTRDAYRPAATASGAPGALTSVASLSELLGKTLPVITDGGVAKPQWDALVAALSATLTDAAAPADATSPERTATLAAQLLLTERADISEAAPLYIVRRDPRGIAIPAAMALPFVDADHNGLADVDALGRFVDGKGALVAVPAPFPTAGDTSARDPAGRSPLYTYLDVGKTVAGALGHDASQLFDPTKGTALDLIRGASALLGPRVAAKHAFGASAFPYTGYDTTQSPLLDMTYGYLTLLRDPNVRDLLALVDTLVGSHTPTAARLVEAAITAARASNGHPEAQIDPAAPLWDDIVPVLRQILARPALVRALLAAMEKPEVKQLAHRFSEYMTYADRFDIDPNTQAVTGSFSKQPDRTKPDTAYNRSLFQRILHLINDSNGAVACNKPGAVVRDPLLGLPIATYNQCALFRVDNLAVFYLQSIAYAKDAQGRYLCESSAGSFGSTQAVAAPTACAGIGTGWRPRPKADFNYNWGGLVSGAVNLQGGDAYVEGQVGIAGMRSHPTPQALNRVLFLDPTPAFLQDVIDPMRDRDGDLFTAQHAGTLPVWENNNFYAEIRPIVQAFADNNSEQLFVDLMSAMHKSWPSQASSSTQHTNPAGTNYAWAGNGVSYEPLMIEVLGGDLMSALVDTAPELDAITVNSKPYATVVGNAGAFALTPLAGLTDRQGRTSTTTADGRPITTLSPWHVLADAYRGKTARIAQTGSEGKAWPDSVSELVDVLFRASSTNTGWSFRNAHVASVTRAMIAFLRARIEAHDLRGDRTIWLAQTMPNNARDLLTHPLFASLVDLAAAISIDTAARSALDAAFRDAFDDAGAPRAAATMRAATADLIQLAADDADLVPIAHMAGALTAPGKPYATTQLAFMKRLRSGDPADTLRTLLGNVFAAYDLDDPSISAIGAIADGIGEVDRAHPVVDAHAAWQPADYASVLHSVAAFLREQQRGLPRFIAIVAGRNP